MKTVLTASLIAVFTVANTSAETYRSVPISALKIEGPVKEVTAAMGQQVDAMQLRMLGARLESESYLTMDDAEVGELPQNLMRLVFSGDADLPLSGAIDLALDYSADEVKTYRFTIPKGSAKAIEEKDFIEARKAWAQARATTRRAPGLAWFRHRAGHTGEQNDRVDASEVMRSFDIFGGGRAIADNLALNRALILGTDPEKGEDKVRIDTIQGVTVKAIDWSDHLPKEPVAIDPLALFIPEDQHVLFAPSLHGLLAMFERVESESGPMLGLLSSDSPYRGLMQRYRRQLGLDLSDAAARLLPVRSVALTGGDPYFATGTDVAILMESPKPEALFKALELAIQAKSGARPQRHSGNGLEHLSFIAPQRGVSSHVCRIGNLVFVSNSVTQVRRLSEVADQRAKALGKSEEFQAFRHRYPQAGESAYVFLSDATIRRWAGPVTRIGASRRNRALAALNELTVRGLSECGKEDEFDALLGRVVMVDGRAVSERFGSAEFLTPISELGLTEVTSLEKEAYEQWRRGYETGWSQVFDPIAIQVKLTDNSVDIDLTVLPLSINSDFQEVIEVAGKAELSPRARLRPDSSILRLACALDAESGFFKQFEEQLVPMLPELKIKPLSWVGESVSVDFLDSLYWEGLGNMDFGTQFAQLPVVARVEVRSKLKLGLFLTAIRTLMQTSAPDAMKWINRKHGERTYVVIAQQDGGDFADPVKICYAITGKALLVALSEKHLKRAMDLEALELKDEQLAKLPPAKSLMLDADPALMSMFDRVMISASEGSRLAKVSAQAIPILNEWRRLFPDQNPVEVHQRLLGVPIACPGGKGYRWNQKHLTMESVVYGHRGAPRQPEKEELGLDRYGRMHSSIDFEEMDGLRLRLHLGPKADLPTLPQPEVGELLGKGVELSAYRPGRVLHYRGKQEYGEHSWQFEVISTEKTPKGLVIHSREPWQDEEDKGEWMGSYLVNEDGIWITGGKDEFTTSTYATPSLDLPLVLRKNEVHHSHSIGVDVYEEDGEKDVDPYRGRQRIRVLGTETIEVPAGKFENCVVIERDVEDLWSDFYDATTSKEWYHPGTGMIKTEDEDGYGGELIKIEEKKAAEGR